jgi:hypothetical protein
MVDKKDFLLWLSKSKLCLRHIGHDEIVYHTGFLARDRLQYTFGDSKKMAIKKLRQLRLEPLGGKPRLTYCQRLVLDGVAVLAKDAQAENQVILFQRRKSKYIYEYVARYSKAAA